LLSEEGKYKQGVEGECGRNIMYLCMKMEKMKPIESIPVLEERADKRQ
jgi:hypothetical protein